jgi:integrase
LQNVPAGVEKCPLPPPTGAPGTSQKHQHVKKTCVPVVLHLGEEALNALKDLASEGFLFPYPSQVCAGDRATEFKQRCRGLGIEGVSLHSYRYAWAERAKACGYPERFAQEALGHNSAAVHRAYAKRAKMKLPSLEEYEKRAISLAVTKS